MGERELGGEVAGDLAFTEAEEKVEGFTLAYGVEGGFGRQNAWLVGAGFDGGEADADVFGGRHGDEGDDVVEGEAGAGCAEGSGDASAGAGQFEDAVVGLDFGELGEGSAGGKTEQAGAVVQEGGWVAGDVGDACGGADELFSVVFAEGCEWGGSPAGEVEGDWKGAGEVFVEELDEGAEAELAAKAVPAREVGFGEASVADACGFEACDGAEGSVEELSVGGHGVTGALWRKRWGKGKEFGRGNAFACACKP